jgi:hypothetical protein
MTRTRARIGSDHWQCTLLRPRRERPSRRASEQRDELAPVLGVQLVSPTLNLCEHIAPLLLALRSRADSVAYISKFFRPFKEPPFSALPLFMRGAPVRRQVARAECRKRRSQDGIDSLMAEAFRSPP